MSSTASQRASALDVTSRSLRNLKNPVIGARSMIVRSRNVSYAVPSDSKSSQPSMKLRREASHQNQPNDVSSHASEQDVAAADWISDARGGISKVRLRWSWK